MRYLVPKIVLCLLIMLFLSACANSVKIRETWKSPEATAAPYRKLLLIAVAKDQNLRQMFENILAETLNAQGVAAVQSYPVLDDLARADKEQIQRLALAVGADAVVVTRGLSRSEHVNYQYFGGNVQERVAVIESVGENSSSLIAMSAVGISPKEMDFVSGTLLTNFFDTAGARLAWSVQTQVVNDGRKADACWDYSILLVKALARDGLVNVNGKGFRKPSL